MSEQHQQYPTLHAIGLGPQLAELERICAESAKGKHAGESIIDNGSAYHMAKAKRHMGFAEMPRLDIDLDSGARHHILAAARLLMAAACLDAEETSGK